jgi:hypothetical protein
MQAAGGLNLSAIQRHGRSLAAGHTLWPSIIFLDLNSRNTIQKIFYKRFAWPEVSVARGEREAIRDPSQATQEA